MNSKTKWTSLKKDLTALSAEDLNEIDLRLSIIGEIIKARQEESLTQTSLEKLCGIKQPMLARVESGDTDPRLGTMLKILKPLGKTLAVVDLPTGDTNK